MDYGEKSADKLTELFSKLIKEDNVSEAIISDYEWHFGDIKEDNEIIFCKLGKIRKIRQKTKFDNKKKTFLEIKSDDEDVFISHLLFDKKNHFFLFEERPEVGYKELTHILTESFKKLNNREIAIAILPNKLEVNKILTGKFTVTKARFLLRPSNPDNSEDLKKMDNLIRDVHAKRATMDFVNDDGLDKESSTFNSALSLSNRGFGSFHLNYTSPDGKKRHFYSKQKQLKDTISKPNSETEWKSKLLDLLSKTIDLLNKNE
ncbi:MAG: hypothetical protein COV33_00970 [Candidatus Zambryskibacteria bacterium CG10_big_fil_rev_8_21_14_0_10_34_34]|uniref:DUF4747 domain-containing protein n=1 Tax=Candidatus Zambryskibacteria bacterium CG10_big_fil_rev_8_21_14_0_10_34_34 TaxID=1975114 RepID=A0A2H0R104_9BACT|nr:MAG: hypothetical protein COV33_00970 [Candidatus Zambryskibacteria bacterium CG10_big_fil_rev_8_21_14_0_10_34_34]